MGTLDEAASGVSGRAVLAKRVQGLKPSTVRTIVDRATALEETGKDIIHLEIGRPCFDTPRLIKDAAADALYRGLVHYAPSRGIRELRNAVAEKLCLHNGLALNGEDNVLITSGNKNATFLCLMGVLNEGDEVLIFDPQYGPHRKQIELLGGVCRPVPLVGSDGWRIKMASLESAMSHRTRLILLNNPLNPVGRVFTREELGHVAEVACQHDLWVITDETYEYIIYDGRQHISIASLPGMKDRTLSTFAFTKTYAMDGWRLGYIAGAEDALEKIESILQLDTSCANTFVQYGAVAAVRDCASDLRRMVAEDERARTITAQMLAEADIPCTTIEGTIYAFPDVSRLRISGDDFAMRLLLDKGVATVPGSAYGVHGADHVRLAFGAVNEARLVEALRRIQRLVTDL